MSTILLPRISSMCRRSTCENQSESCVWKEIERFFFYRIALIENKKKKKLSFSFSPSPLIYFDFNEDSSLFSELGNRTYQSVRLIEETRGITVDTFDPFEGWNAIRCSWYLRPFLAVKLELTRFLVPTLLECSIITSRQQRFETASFETSKLKFFNGPLTWKFFFLDQWFSTNVPLSEMKIIYYFYISLSIDITFSPNIYSIIWTEEVITFYRMQNLFICSGL